MKTHITVLRDEAIEALALTPKATVVDATVGSSGHAERIVASLGKDGTFVGIDADEEAIARAHDMLKGASCAVHLITDNFRDIDSILERLHITHVDAILADLGWRMEQMGGNGRGFSFLVDEPLIMTFGEPGTYPFVARDIVNEWERDDLRNAFAGYGEERYAGRIADAIVRERERRPIETTFDLRDVIVRSVPARYRHGRIHPATKTFQALRMTVNDELDSLDMFMRKSIDILGPHGRLAIISFHSIEDRVVKHLMREMHEAGKGDILTKKPISPRNEEVRTNPRSRSAKLRIFKKT